MTETLTDPAELCRRLQIADRVASDARRVTENAEGGGYGLRFPTRLLERVTLGDADDPVLRQFLPQVEELRTVEGFSADPLDEATAARKGPLLQKYAGRALLLTGGTCAANCRFCFRRGVFSTHGAENRRFFGVGDDFAEREGRWGAIFQPIAADPTIRELIFSGGEPLGLPLTAWKTVFHYIKSLPYVKRVRIHTRRAILEPEGVRGHLEILKRVSGRKKSTDGIMSVVVFHINHPAEIDSGVEGMFAELADAGIPLFAQSVLLAGVNDRTEILAALYEKLGENRVIPYYLHQLDRVSGAAHFEVPVERGIRIFQELRTKLPGWLLPRYVREIPGEPAKHLLFSTE